MKKYTNKILHLSILPITIIGILVMLTPLLSTPELIILLITLLLTIQGGLVTTSMLYGLTKDQQSISSDQLTDKQLSFSLILPVKNEEHVIGDTIRTLDNIHYPHNLIEILIPVRADDYETIRAINNAVTSCNSNIRVIPIDGDANTKAYSLNIALHYASGDIVGVFDAEDEPHPDLLTRINQEFHSNHDYDAIQAPVQLINLNSSWYSSLNSLEYYFWFQSVLPFLTRHGVTPLGGNTIFIKKDVLTKLGGWDENCLTEDADLGIRMSASNKIIGIVTDSKLATLEETPSDELGIIKQRSRWDQGYLQVIGKHDWQLLGTKQKILALYTLSQPIFRHLAFLNMVLTPILTIFMHVNPFIAMISFIPTYFLLMQWGMYLLALHTISHTYQIKISPLRYLTTILFFYPYQALLSLATFRALGKLLLGDNSWDKTNHFNTHRTALAVST